MSDKQLEFSFDDPSKPRKKPSRKSSRKSEVLAPTSEGAATYVDFSKTRTPQQKPARRKPATRRGVVAHLTRKGELKLKDVGKRKGYRSIAGGYVAFLVLGVVVVFLGMLVYVKGYQALTRLPKNAVEKVSQLVQPGERLVTVKIESGMSASQVARLLQEQGVVDGADALLAFLQDHDLATKVQKGTYQFRGRPTIEQVAQAITRSAPATLSIIQAGWTLNQVDGYLAQRGYAREGQFLDAAKAVAAEYGLSFTEGWFLSGSYGVSGARTLAEAMHQSAVDAACVGHAGEAVPDAVDAGVDCLDVGLVDGLTAVSLEAKFGNLWHAVDGHAYHANGRVLRAQPKRRLSQFDFIGLLGLGVCRAALPQLLDAVVELLGLGPNFGP